MIFETERLVVRQLKFSDLNSFHKMESNPKVLQFAEGNVKGLEANREELKELIDKYNQPKNDFWIYAIVKKLDNNFIGTVALVKNGSDDEIGYRFLEEFWNQGYGFEVCKGLIDYCKVMGLTKIIGYVVDANVASAKILEKLNFKIINRFTDSNTGEPETKYELIL